MKRFLSTAALAFYPIEAFQLEMMEDDRFDRHCESLWSTIRTEASYVTELPEHVLSDIVEAAGLQVPPSEYREWVLRCMPVSIGFLHMEAFAEVAVEPMSFTQGDVEANIMRLQAQAAPPAEPRLRQCWHLMRCGAQPEQLTRLWLLLHDAPCSTQLCEKGLA